MKIQKKKKNFLGGGGVVGGGGGRFGGVRVDVNEELKFFVKIQEKNLGVGIGGGGRGRVEGRSGWM